MNNEMLNSMLLQTYFGFSDCDLNDEETLIAKCCDRAYKDMCRTLRFNKVAGATVYKDRWKDQVSNAVIEAIRNIDPDSVAFDGYHETTCKNMMEVSCEGVFDNEELPLGVMPVLALGYSGLAYIDRYLPAVFGMYKFRE